MLKTGIIKGNGYNLSKVDSGNPLAGGGKVAEVASAAAVRAIMRRHGISCRKSLGQNFLMDQNIARKIVGAAELTPSDLVVEVGPGLGALTALAARGAGRVLAVEFDAGLLPALAGVLKDLSNVDIIQGDALKVDYDRLAGEKTGGVYGKSGSKYKLLANLPYYITSPLLMHLLHGRFNISLMVLMVQSEVADRLAAFPGTGSYGAISLAVQYFTEPKLLFRVPRTVFYPQPGVDSAVVRLAVRPAPAVAVRDEQTFFKVVRAAFGKRRKTLLNSLASSGLGIGKETCLQAIESAGIDPGRRGETLSLEEFALLTDKFLDASC